jgi:hypothetical protein
LGIATLLGLDELCVPRRKPSIYHTMLIWVVVLKCLDVTDIGSEGRTGQALTLLRAKTDTPPATKNVHRYSCRV